MQGSSPPPPPLRLPSQNDDTQDPHFDPPSASLPDGDTVLPPHRPSSPGWGQCCSEDRESPSSWLRIPKELGQKSRLTLDGPSGRLRGGDRGCSCVESGSKTELGTLYFSLANPSSPKWGQCCSRANRGPLRTGAGPLSRGPGSEMPSASHIGNRVGGVGDTLLLPRQSVLAQMGTVLFGQEVAFLLAQDPEGIESKESVDSGWPFGTFEGRR